MKKIYFILIFNGYLYSLEAQTPAELFEIHIFEQQWTQFKYDLFPDLYQISDYAHLLDTLQNLAIIQKLDDFIQKNKSQIIDYQRIKLKTYTNFKVDFGAYQPDTILTSSELEVLHTGISQGRGREYENLLKFKHISPAEMVYFYFNVLMGRRLTASEMANFYLRNSIANPLFLSQSMGNDKWKIWFDAYQFLVEFEYDIAQMHCRPLQVWVRKK
ncbi:MAG: hypothetical protein MUE85_02055 [Microscillaceae bacterium]|jgi:hypothetical protein|nr:hypothetical protein [Microscillaceae bacterium]